MDRAEIEMGEAARRAQTMPSGEESTGRLSEEEESAVPRDARWIESHVSLLYMHLDIAARHRQHLARSGGANQVSERGHSKAITRAREIYEELVAEGWKPDGLIAQMMLAERA